MLAAVACILGGAAWSAGGVWLLARATRRRAGSAGFTVDQGARAILGFLLGFFLVAVLERAVVDHLGGAPGALARLAEHGGAAVFMIAYIGQMCAGRDALGLRAAPAKGALLQGGLAYLAFIPVVAGAHWLNTHVIVQGTERVQEAMRDMLADPGSPRYWITVATVVIVVPVYEETLFRGILQQALQSLFGQNRDPATARFLAIAAASTIFALLHDWFTFVPVFVLAVFLGWLYARTGSLLVVIALHGAHNLVVVAYETLVRAWASSRLP